MSQDYPAESPPPDTQSVKTIGVLNIVFGVLLMLGGLCVGLYMVVLIPNLGSLVEVQQKAITQQVEARRKAEVESLDRQEADATTEEEKARIRAERERVLAAPMPPAPPEMPFKKMGFEDPKFIGHYAADCVTGLFLNLLMIAGGIGLVRRRPWGWSLSRWVAGLKILRLLLLTASFLFLVGPMMARKMAAMPGGAGGARTSQVTGAAFAVGFLFVASIYPVVTLLVLGRPDVRAAVRAKPEGGVP